jgi:hypothetical protein
VDVGRFRSNHLDGIGRHPNVELLESRFELLLVVNKERVIFGRVSNIHKEAHQIVAELFTLMLPVAANHL